MKKIFLFIIISFMLSGCTANYEINLNGDKIEEKLTILETNKEIFDKQTDTGFTLRESFESLSDKDIFGEETYKIKSLTNDNQLGVELTSKSAISILNSSIISQCYRNPSVGADGSIVTINTGSEFECYEFYDNLETVRVVFKTNHKVISSNAETVKGDKYIWNFTKDSNKLIQITYDDSITKKNFVLYIVAGVIVLIFVIVGCFIIKKVRNKNNI